MYTLSNEAITITVAERGAELQSIFHKGYQQEYMWSAGEAWPKKSPVLFPIVGGLKNNSYNFNGKQYNLPRHGFAREKDFTLLHQSADELVFQLQSSAETKLAFPFDFNLSISYKISEATLTIGSAVENTGTGDMYFSVGAHPAFAVPLETGLTYNDYHFAFNTNENAPRWPLADGGLIDTSPTPLLTNSNRLPLTKELFEKDAVVFKHLASDEIKLASEKGERGLTVSFAGFPYMGLWAAKGADFVCIEPWYGIADSVNATGNLEDKEGINRLGEGELFKRSYAISVF